MFPPKIPAPNTTPNPTGIPSTSSRYSGVGARVGQILGALLLKKKWESIAIALPPSFDGTDKPRAPFMAQSGGAR